MALPITRQIEKKKSPHLVNELQKGTVAANASGTFPPPAHVPGASVQGTVCTFVSKDTNIILFIPHAVTSVCIIFISNKLVCSCGKHTHLEFPWFDCNIHKDNSPKSLRHGLFHHQTHWVIPADSQSALSSFSVQPNPNDALKPPLRSSVD
jgi:hypothetical protein